MPFRKVATLITGLRKRISRLEDEESSSSSSSSRNNDEQLAATMRSSALLVDLCYLDQALASLHEAEDEANATRGALAELLDAQKDFTDGRALELEKLEEVSNRTPGIGIGLSG